MNTYEVTTKLVVEAENEEEALFIYAVETPNLVPEVTQEEQEGKGLDPIPHHPDATVFGECVACKTLIGVPWEPLCANCHAKWKEQEKQA